MSFFVHVTNYRYTMDTGLNFISICKGLPAIHRNLGRWCVGLLDESLWFYGFMSCQTALNVERVELYMPEDTNLNALRLCNFL